ncbi:MAG TPA: hypothetical protein VHF58_08420 [Solirubrobacterales bacterium]|nr:hypothetical protein [Solirubrobacterales bacterium]
MASTPPTPETQAVCTVSFALVLGGLFTIGVAVYLGSAVDSVLYLIALVGLADFAVAWAFRTGRIGPLAQRRRPAGAGGNVAAELERDPSYNPYARED